LSINRFWGKDKACEKLIEYEYRKQVKYKNLSPVARMNDKLDRLGNRMFVKKLVLYR
jgi:hypothetical protein